MRRRKQAIPILLCCLAVSLPLVVGCGGQTIEVDEEKKTPRQGELGKLAYPIMLHKKQVRSRGRALTLDKHRITDVAVDDVSSPAADGSYTATVSFLHERASGDLRVKVKVTYSIRKTTSTSGIVVETYPVKKVQALSIEDSEAEN